MINVIFHVFIKPQMEIMQHKGKCDIILWNLYYYWYTLLGEQILRYLISMFDSKFLCYNENISHRFSTIHIPVITSVFPECVNPFLRKGGPLYAFYMNSAKNLGTTNPENVEAGLFWRCFLSYCMIFYDLGTSTR